MSSLFTVQAAQPAQIYPDGLQDAVTVVNNGPGFIYLDESSSVNTSSYPLAPTGSVVWDAQRPLFAIAALLDAEVSVTNMGSVQFNRANYTRKIYSQYGVGTVLTNNDLIMDQIDVSAYTSIQILVTPEDSYVPVSGTGKWWDCNIVWSDEDGQNINVNYAIVSNGILVNWVGPTLGSRVDFFFTNNTGQNVPVKSIEVWGFTQTQPMYTQGSGVNAVSPTGLSAFSWDGVGAVTGWDGSEIILPASYGSSLTINVLTTATITAAGSIEVQPVNTSVWILGEMTIPTATGRNSATKTFVVPAGVQLRLGGTQPTTAGVCRVTCTWGSWPGARPF